MTKKVINIGGIPNDGTGDYIRVGFGKVNDNFTELYDSTANAQATADGKAAIDDTTASTDPTANIFTRSASKIASLIAVPQAAAVAAQGTANAAGTAAANALSVANSKAAIDDATVDTDPTAGVFTRSASKIAALIASAVSTATRVAANRTALANTAVKSLPAYMPEANISSWWDFYSNANYLAAFGNSVTTDAAIDTAQGAIVAAADSTGAWVRRHNGRLSPFHFGAVGKKEGQTTGWVDDAPALNAWAAWLVSRVNQRVVGDCTGKFVINSQVSFGSRTATTTRGVLLIGSMELYANAVMDRMLETRRIEYFQITGQLHLFGGGPDTTGGDVVWASRLAKIGWYNFGCSHANIDIFHARFFQVAGYFTAGSTGAQANDCCRFGIARLHFCGSGVIGTDSLQANYSSPVNSGSANSVNQLTTLTVDAIPPSYLTDISAGSDAFNGGQVLPVGAFINGRVYQVTAVDATHVALYPWIDSTVPTSGTITYIFGAGILDRGSDANVYEIGLIDGQFCGVIFWDLAIYGAHINQVQASSSGVAYMVGGGRASSSIGGGIESFYPEGNTNDFVVFDNFQTGVVWKNGGFGMYEGNLAKCYVALVPRAADNSFDPVQSMFAQMPMQYNGTRLTHQGHPGNNLFYGKSAIDWTLGTIPQIYGGMGATTVTIHPPLTNCPGGVRPSDDWTQLPDLNRLYGHDSSMCVFMGTAASGAPGGAITFTASMQYRTAVVTSGSAVITGLASTTGLVAGMPAQASGSAATTILSVDSSTQITLAANPTATTTLIKLPGASVNGASTAVFSTFGGAAVFGAYYRFSTNDIIIRQVAGTGAVFTGDSGTGGANGLVPAPAAGDAAAGKFLAAHGDWETPTPAAVAVFDDTHNGLVPASGGGTTNFLRADHTFAPPPGSGGSSVLIAQVQGNATGTPGTGAFTVGTTPSNESAWSTMPTGFYFVRFDDGGAWERTFSYWNGTTLSRSATQVFDSSSGSQLTLTPAATASLLSPALDIPSRVQSLNYRGFIGGLSGGGSTAIGTAAASLDGTGSSSSPVAGSYYSERFGSRSISGTLVNNQASFYAAVALAMVNTTAGRGGFNSLFDFGIESIPTSPRFLVGLTSVTYHNVTTDPSALTANIAAFAADAGDTNFQLLTNNNSGSGTKIDTGISIAALGWYVGKIWCAPGSNKIYALLLRMDNGTCWFGSTTTDCPVTGALLIPQMFAALNSTNAGTAVAIKMDRMLVAQAVQ